MAIPIEDEIPREFDVEPEVANILYWMWRTNPDKRRNLKSSTEVITITQFEEAAKLSMLFQKMKLCEGYIDPLKLSHKSSAIVPREKLAELISYEEGLSQFDFTNNDPGLFLVMENKMKHSEHPKMESISFFDHEQLQTN